MLLAKDGEFELVIPCDTSQAEKNIDALEKKLDELKQRATGMNNIKINIKNVSGKGAETFFKQLQKSLNYTAENVKKQAATITAEIDKITDANGKINGNLEGEDSEKYKRSADEIKELIQVYVDYAEAIRNAKQAEASLMASGQAKEEAKETAQEDADADKWARADERLQQYLDDLESVKDMEKDIAGMKEEMFDSDLAGSEKLNAEKYYDEFQKQAEKVADDIQLDINIEQNNEGNFSEERISELEGYAEQEDAIMMDLMDRYNELRKAHEMLMDELSEGRTGRRGTFDADEEEEDELEEEESREERLQRRAERSREVISGIGRGIRDIVSGLAVGIADIMSQVVLAVEGATKSLLRFQIVIGKGVVNAVKRGIGAIKQLIARIKHTGEEATRSFKRLLRYTLGLRGMFTLFRRIRTAVKQAIKNLVQFDKAFGDNVTSVNNSISMLKNAFLQLKNQVIAAFAPLINIVIPQYVVPMINAIISAMQKLAMFIAYLTGAPKWIRAKKVNDDYAKSLDNVGGSAKKAANNLSSLDEIHLWQDDNGGGGGGGGDTTKPEDMFEWVDTPEDMVIDPEQLAKNLADKINAAIDQVNWEGIGEKIAHYMNNVLTYVNTLLDNINWGSLGSGFASTINAIMTNGKWEELGEFLVQKKNVLTALLNGFFDNLSWKDLSDAITRTISSAIEHINIQGMAHLITNVVTGVLDVVGDVISQTNWDTLAYKFIEGLATIAEGAENFDWSGLGAKIAEGINKIPWSQLITSVIDAGGSLFGGILDSLVSAVESLDINKLTKAASEGVTKFFRALTAIVKKVDWSEIGDAIAEFMGSVDFSEMLDAFLEYEETFFKAVAKVIGGLFEGMKVAIPKIWLEIQEVAVDVLGLTPQNIGNAIMGALGAVLALGGAHAFALNPVTGTVMMFAGLALVFTAFTVSAQEGMGAESGEQIATAIAGVVGALGIAFAPVTGGWSLIATAVASLVIAGITLVVSERAKQEAEMGVTALKEETKKMVEDAKEATDFVVEFNAKAKLKVESVEADYELVREQLHTLLNIDTSDGVTSTELKKIDDALLIMKQTLSEDEYNALGLYFSDATGSIESAYGAIQDCSEELDVLIDKMLESARVEAMRDLYIENYKEIIKAQKAVSETTSAKEEAQGTVKLLEDVGAGLERIRQQASDKGFSLTSVFSWENNSSGKTAWGKEFLQDVRYELDITTDYLKTLGITVEKTGNTQQYYRNVVKGVEEAQKTYGDRVVDLTEQLDGERTTLIGITEDGQYYYQSIQDGIDVIYASTEANGKAEETLYGLETAYGAGAKAVTEFGEEIGVMVDEAGNLVVRNEELADSAYLVVDAEGKVVDSHNMVTASADGVLEMNGKIIGGYKDFVDENGEVIDAIGARITSDGKLITSDGKVIESNVKVRKEGKDYITLIELMASMTGDKATAMSEAWKRWSESSNGSIDIAQEKFEGLPAALETQLKQLEQDAQSNGITMEQLMGDNGTNIVKGLFMGMGTQWTEDEGELEEMWNAIGDTLCTLLGINSPSTVMSEYGGYIMQGLLEGMKTEFDPITEFFNSVAEAAKSAFADIPANIASGLSGMGGRIKAPLNDAITVMNSFISKMISVANKFASTFNSIRTGINSLPNTTKLPYLMQVSGFSVSALATGAVIPPNAPFLAMLGDQSHGRNLEAPESLIREIMREELGTASKGGSYQFVAQLNRRTLFEEMIDEAEMRQLRTGENPFML